MPNSLTALCFRNIPCNFFCPKPNRAGTHALDCTCDLWHVWEWCGKPAFWCPSRLPLMMATLSSLNCPAWKSLATRGQWLLEMVAYFLLVSLSVNRVVSSGHFPGQHKSGIWNELSWLERSLAWPGSSLWLRNSWNVWVVISFCFASTHKASKNSETLVQISGIHWKRQLHLFWRLCQPRNQGLWMSLSGGFRCSINGNGWILKRIRW